MEVTAPGHVYTPSPALWPAFVPPCAVVFDAFAAGSTSLPSAYLCEPATAGGEANTSPVFQLALLGVPVDGLVRTCYV